MQHDDFKLTDVELQKINEHIGACAEAFARTKESAAQSVSVTFEFVVNVGRCISVRYDGQTAGSVVIDFE